MENKTKLKLRISVIKKRKLNTKRDTTNAGRLKATPRTLQMAHSW